MGKTSLHGTKCQDMFTCPFCPTSPIIQSLYSPVPVHPVRMVASVQSLFSHQCLYENSCHVSLNIWMSSGHAPHPGWRGPSSHRGWWVMDRLSSLLSGLFSVVFLMRGVLGSRVLGCVSAGTCRQSPSGHRFKVGAPVCQGWSVLACLFEVSEAALLD